MTHDGTHDIFCAGSQKQIRVAGKKEGLIRQIDGFVGRRPSGIAMG